MTIVTSSLAELADEYWQASLAFSPVAATAIGDRRFDDRMDDVSPEAIDAQRQRLVALRDRVEAVERGGLDGTDLVTRSALIAQISSDVAMLETGLEAWTVDPLEGPQVVALDLEAIQLVSTPDQARAMVARWRALGPWFDQQAANLRRGLAAGRVAVRTPVDKAVEQMEGILGRADAELPLLKPLEEAHEEWSAAERQSFADGLRTAVRDIVRPALERYCAVVRDEILPAARPDERAGILHVAGGGDAYTRLIRLHTSLDLSPDEIHRIGLDEVARIDAELAGLGGRVLGTTDPEDIRSRLRSDPALHFTTREEVFATAEEALARARAAIPEWFGLLPVADCAVVRMSEHEEKHSTIAYYRQPAIDGSRPGQYYVNTYAPETRPRYEAEALAYHESIPGHHLQIAIGQELTALPEFRKHLGPTSFFEGWGLYTERLSDEMGLYSGDLDRIGILSFDGWRACRLVVDTGIHALSWTRQQAIDFMTAHTALAPNNIANEIDRYIVWPGQALAYKIGQLEILRLRSEARAAAGARFDIRAFHDAVLGQGAVGLETLAEIVSTHFATASPS
jgi:uncharacterized protein (DUF885 family)